MRHRTPNPNADALLHHLRTRLNEAVWDCAADVLERIGEEESVGRRRHMRRAAREHIDELFEALKVQHDLRLPNGTMLRTMQPVEFNRPQEYDAPAASERPLMQLLARSLHRRVNDRTLRRFTAGANVTRNDLAMGNGGGSAITVDEAVAVFLHRSARDYWRRECVTYARRIVRAETEALLADVDAFLQTV
jgi:hypothetical protein